MTQPITATNVLELTGKCQGLIDQLFAVEKAPKFEVTYNWTLNVFHASSVVIGYKKSSTRPKLIFEGAFNDMSYYTSAGSARSHGVVESPLGAFYWRTR